MNKISIESTYTAKEELTHSFLHGIGVAFGVIAIPYLLWITTQTGNILYLASTCVYASGFLMTFTFSTLYHGTRGGRLKAIFQLLDHISIYVLIAGTYTPLIVKYMFNTKGIPLTHGCMALLFYGNYFKNFLSGKIQVLRCVPLFNYGFNVSAGKQEFFAAMPADVIALIVAGAALYLVGVTFYLFRRWKYHHATWHLLTLSAGICHFGAVLLAFR